MKLWRVDDVMTGDVVSVRVDASYQEVVDLLISRRVSAVPVVDRYDRPVGIVSETDLLYKVENTAADREPGRFAGRRRRTAHAKALARTAGDVMTSPVVTAAPATSVVAAARLMHERDVKRLPVVTAEGELVGIVTRSDLLKVHLRTDDEVRDDVRAEIHSAFPDLAGGVVRVESARGEVTLRGRVHFRSAAVRMAALARGLSGVVAVSDGLTYDIDDSLAMGSEAGTPFGVA